MDWRRMVEMVKSGSWRMEILSKGDCVMNCVLERFREEGKITEGSVDSKNVILEFLDQLMDETSIFEDNFGITDDEHFTVLMNDEQIYIIEHPEPENEGWGCRKEARVWIKKISEAGM
ncbi:MAG: hypothetical protein QW328_08740 [Nitrososphaerota archaeon]